MDRRPSWRTFVLSPCQCRQQLGQPVGLRIVQFVAEMTLDGGGRHRPLPLEFGRVEAELRAGPFFAGAAFSLVDAVFAPIFRYFDVFDTIAPTGIFDASPRVTSWRNALAARRSVREAVGDDYPDRLRVFLRSHDAWLLKTAA